LNKYNNSTLSLKSTLTLPCGVVLKNRIAKSPMSDSLGDGKGNPTVKQIRLYERWAQGGTALSFIGEVQGDYHYPEKPGNLVLNENSDIELLKQLSSKALIDDSHIWPQIGHAGALSHLPISEPKGPSSLDLEGLKCEEMSIEEVKELPLMYARTALLAKEVGFSGIQIHAGHGFLLSQFLSPLFNKRKDEFGDSIKERSKIVLEIIQSVRNALGSSFPIAIRINSSDLLESGLTQEDSLEFIKLLDDSSIDLIDISGGTYFPGAKASSEGISNGPYFLDFAKSARQVTFKPLMITGGFKNKKEALDAISSGVVDMINIGRAMVLNPNLANDWMNDTNVEVKFPRFESSVLGGITAWYIMLLTAISEDREKEFDLELLTALKEYEKRDAIRCNIWKDTFY
jgi:2,4-dienoyl-CoA reductase-like NADH-dependent reductase (Old Yellow Enzyme family)